MLQGVFGAAWIVTRAVPPVDPLWTEETTTREEDPEDDEVDVIDEDDDDDTDDELAFDAADGLRQSAPVASPSQQNRSLFSRSRSPFGPLIQVW